MPQKPKILIVEDDEVVARVYRILEKDGFELTFAFNGREGLEALKRQKPDLILLDIMMPEMDGIEMLKIVKADPNFKDIPVVFLTNLGSRPEDIEKCKAMGVEDYWVKANISLTEIAQGIKRILKQKSERSSFEPLL